MIRTGALVLALSLIFVGDTLASIRIPEGVVMTSTRATAYSGMAQQPNLICKDNGPVCATKEYWEQWARKQGKVERHERVSSSDSKRLVVNGWGEDYVPSGASAPVQAPPKKVPLGLKTKIPDPKTGAPLEIDISTPAGRSFVMSIGPNWREEVGQVAGVVVPQILDFVSRQKELEVMRERFSEHARQADATKDAYIGSLRNYSEQARAAAGAIERQGFADLASGLTSSAAGLMTATEREAFSRARQIAASDLRHTDYAMNEEAAVLLEQELERLMTNGEVSKAAKVLEALQGATVDGRERKSKVASSYTNASGILQTGGLFDGRTLHAPIRSVEGQMIARIMNRYQAMWTESDELAALSREEQARYVLGAVALSVGEEALSQGQAARGAALASLSQVMIDSIAGFGAGLGQSVKELAMAIPELAVLAADGASALIRDPSGSWSATTNFIMNLDEVGGAILTVVQNDFDTLANGNAYGRGEVLGKYAIDVVSLVMSGGAVQAAKKVSSAGRVAVALARNREALRVSRVFEAAGKASSSVRTAIHSSALAATTRAIETTRTMAGAARTGLTALSRQSPEIAYELARTHVRLARNGAQATVAYLERVAASKNHIPSVEKISEIAEYHQKVLKELDTVQGVSREGTFSRGVAKKFRTPDGQVLAHPTSVFDTPSVNAMSEHRFTIGGDLGQRGLYMTEGSVEKTRALIASEITRPSAEVLFGQAHMKADRLLDLTNSKVVERLLPLGRKEAEILKDASYGFSQALGDAAVQKGFSGIIFSSAKSEGFINMVLFR